MLARVAPLLASLTAVAAFLEEKSCPIAFDGRVPINDTSKDFDATSTSPFRPDYVYGANLTWSQIVKFPPVEPSLFDWAVRAKPLEVTIDDRSVFAPSATNIQYGFRRAELLPAIHSGENVYVTGKKTLHFSLMTDSHRPLNYSHEYQLVFVESADYSTNQLVLKTGTLIGNTGQKNAKSLMLQGNQAAPIVETIFETKLEDDTWYNFGLVLDFDRNTTQVLFSSGQDHLTAHTSVVSNNLSGLGEWHFGVLKKPTGDVSDITTQGYQESGIHEGIIFGGIFQEDSSSGCVSYH